MNDTSKAVAEKVAERHRRMTPTERMEIAASLFETARAIIDSSLPRNLSIAERRLAWARRVYGSELQEAALLAYARHVPQGQSDAGSSLDER